MMIEPANVPSGTPVRTATGEETVDTTLVGPVSPGTYRSYTPARRSPAWTRRTR